jgi:predicted ATPase
VVALCSEHGFPFWLAYGRILRGWALAHQDHGEEGISQIREGMEAMRATGAVFMESYWIALLAESYGRVGRADEGLTVLAEAHAVIDRHEEHFLEAEIHRLEGELLLKSASPDPYEAKDRFRKAIDVARRQQAKSWELRAVTSLSRLLQKPGQEGRSPPDASRDLQLVHRGLRHGGSEGRQGAARRAVMKSESQ